LIYIPKETSHQFNNNGTYSVTLTVTDNYGHSNNISKPVFVGGVYITGILSGWNFVSLPFYQTIDHYDLIINYLGVDYTWLEATNPSNGPIVDPNIYGWNRYMDQYYQVTDTLVTGYGYWFYSYFDCTFGIYGIPIYSGSNITDLKQTWNIIGVPYVEPVNKTDLIINYLGTDYTWAEAIDPLNGPIVDPNVYGWDRINGMYVPAGNTLDPGYAYWVYTYEDCTLKRL